MDLQKLLSSITPDIYQNLKLAVEIGKWPDGNKLSSEQRQLCMQAVIAYEHKNLPPEEPVTYRRNRILFVAMITSMTTLKQNNLLNGLNNPVRNLYVSYRAEAPVNLFERL
jgi:uncharacterized protein YeaC (DUF1315 family)